MVTADDRAALPHHVRLAEQLPVVSCLHVQFVDATIAGLLSWRSEVDALLAKLRAQVYFTQQQEQQQVRDVQFMK
jgi:hypothetical protein